MIKVAVVKWTTFNISGQAIQFSVKTRETRPGQASVTPLSLMCLFVVFPVFVLVVDDVDDMRCVCQVVCLVSMCDLTVCLGGGWS